MSTQSELVSARATAGAAYATAYNAFKAAYIELDAIERTLVNGNVAYAGELPGFGGVRPWDAVERFRHATYLPNPKGDWESDIVVSLVTKLKAYPTPN